MQITPTTLEKLREHWWALVDQDGLDIPLENVHQKNVFGESPLHIAAWKGDSSDIRWLVENG